MKNQLRKFCSVIFILLAVSCQKDDICPPGADITPHLIMEFYDVDDPSSLQAVEDLMVTATGKEEVYFGPETTNEIAIPLRTDQNYTEYHLTIETEEGVENTDVVRFYYTPSTLYLNRACGFKVNYLDLKVEIQEEAGENWISSITVIQKIVENEIAPHIYLFH